MIRTALEAETDELVTLAEGTNVFKPLELVALRELLERRVTGKVCLTP